MLCIQDGSDLNYSTLERCEGLGSIGTNQTGKQRQGLHLHSTFAVTSSGLPLGVLRAECAAREQRSPEDDRPLSAVPIEEKNAFSWIQGVRDCMDIKPLMPPISLWIIYVKEEKPPAGALAIEWFLLTTIDIQSKDDALDCITWYCLRWRIEDWHRVLKSGRGVEVLAHKTAERLKRAIAINLVIAWRIMLMMLMGREMPELPPDVLFSDIEIEVLQAYAKKKGLTLLQYCHCH